MTGQALLGHLDEADYLAKRPLRDGTPDRRQPRRATRRPYRYVIQQVTDGMFRTRKEARREGEDDVLIGGVPRCLGGPFSRRSRRPYEAGQLQSRPGTGRKNAPIHVQVNVARRCLAFPWSSMRASDATHARHAAGEHVQVLLDPDVPGIVGVQVRERSREWCGGVLHGVQHPGSKLLLPDFRCVAAHRVVLGVASIVPRDSVGTSFTAVVVDATAHGIGQALRFGEDRRKFSRFVFFPLLA